MTLTALIESIRAIPHPHASLTVHVESEHIVTALRKGWPAVWSERAWLKGDGTPVKNRDLWELLECETEPHEMRWQQFTADGGSEQTRVIAIATARR
jgi:ribonuclease HI